jgi:antitoxin component of MazEF toxin-antitoxin module
MSVPEGTRMIEEIMFRQSGDSVAFTLPDRMVERLGLQAGETVYAIETDDGILLTRDPGPVGVLDSANRISARYQNALRELAK